jgi:hypothetical protein
MIVLPPLLRPLCVIATGGSAEIVLTHDSGSAAASGPSGFIPQRRLKAVLAASG